MQFDCLLLLDICGVLVFAHCYWIYVECFVTVVVDVWCACSFLFLLAFVQI